MHYYRGPDEDTAFDRLREAPLLAVDVETVHTNDLTCIGIGVYIADNEGFYFTTFPEMDEFVPELLGILGDPERTKIYHNGGNFDLRVLDLLARDEGLTPPDDTGYEDTSIMAQVCGLPASLERLGKEHLAFDDLFSIQDLFKEYNTKEMLSVPVESVAYKCLNDCQSTWNMYWYLQAWFLDRYKEECYEVDRKLIHILRQVDGKGLRLRENLVEEYYQSLQRKTMEIRTECEAEGFNPGSSAQVGFVLAARGNILPFTQSRKQLRANEEILEGLDDPLAKRVLEYRKASKLLSSYIVPWRGKDRAYTHFRLNLATGRLASGKYNDWDTVNRNLQNIPKSMREIFGPDDGVWSWADYSQIELRILAYMSQDREMLAEYSKESPDLHTLTADTAGISRQDGKTFNFAMVYGASDRHLSNVLGVPIDRVRDIKTAWMQRFTGAAEFMRRQMYGHGSAVETAFGRACRLPEPMEGAEVNPRKFEAHVQKCAVNYPIQGTAADIIKRGMVSVWNQGVDLRAQVHDEYLVNGQWTPEPELERIHPELYTPIETAHGLSWSQY